MEPGENHNVISDARDWEVSILRIRPRRGPRVVGRVLSLELLLPLGAVQCRMAVVTTDVAIV